MSEQIIMLCSVLAVLALTGAIFVRRAARYRRRIAGAAVSVNVTESAAENVNPEQEALPPPQRYIFSIEYLYNFIYSVPKPVKKGKNVSIREKYHRRIRQIVGLTEGGHITISGYVDNVLRAHFEQYGKDIDAHLRGSALEMPQERE